MLDNRGTLHLLLVGSEFGTCRKNVGKMAEDLVNAVKMFDENLVIAEKLLENCLKVW